MTSLRTPQALADAGLIDRERVAELAPVAARYAIAITPAVAELIGEADDPIARQFIPSVEELAAGADELVDPIGDEAHSPAPGIVHRYPDRVLLKLTHLCATYCRFCFRRETVGPGASQALAEEEIEAALYYVEARPQIWEVIFTGGDPLVLSPRRLKAVVDRLGRIGHVKVIRFHTRAPVVDPDTITDELVAALKAPGKASYVALHANHPRELSQAARAACARIVDAGIPMISQSVLLRGVNDDAETLSALMRAFVETRIKPYYLHHLDPAPGTRRFRTNLEAGQSLMRAMRGQLSGLCQPTYMLDVEGGAGKVPVGPCYLETNGVRDPWGRLHRRPAD